MTEIGSVLRERREAFGASLQDVAQWSHVPYKEVEEAEATGRISSTLFERLCRGLAVAPVDVVRGGAGTPTRTVARFRQAGDLSLNASDVRLLAAASEVGIVLATLLDGLGEKSRFEGYRSIEAVRTHMEPWEHGYMLGEAARATMEQGSEPIRNLERALNETGIHVARVRMSGGLDAASLWERGAVPVILINGASSKMRYTLPRRASLAHELCHLMHDGGETDMATRVSMSSDVSTNEGAIEQRARAFAPAYLAPRDAVKRWAQSPAAPWKAVTELASHWGLSFEGAAWHAKNCGLITPEAAESLANNRPAELPHEDFEVEDSGFPPQMVDERLPSSSSPMMEGMATSVVIRALEAQVISVGRARELLEWE